MIGDKKGLSVNATAGNYTSRCLWSDKLLREEKEREGERRERVPSIMKKKKRRKRRRRRRKRKRKRKRRRRRRKGKGETRSSTKSLKTFVESTENFIWILVWLFLFIDVHIGKVLVH